MVAHQEITLDVHDNSEQQQAEEQVANNPDSDSETKLLCLGPRIAKNTTVWPTKENFLVRVFLAIMELVRPLFHWISCHWNKIFVISCVFAVLLDPLFLYIPIINHDIKCLGMDKKMNNSAIALRSITDCFYLVDIILQLSKFGTIWRSYIVIDILAILPLPQIEILVFFTKPRGWISVIMNSSFLLQYVPRVLRIYFSCKELEETPQEEIGLWVKGVFTFFLYILASHVLGALWYFFGIQRMTTCWHSACRIENGCKPSTFDCDNQSRNSTLLNDSCPINPPNATIFDFGIFLEVLQYDISGSRNHPQKFSNCFWWGLRNLSSLGSNLQASINTWENVFVASISLTGLLLFLYLMGKLQAYMLDSARREAHKHKMKIVRKVEEKGPEIDLWLSEKFPFIPESSRENVMSQIMRKVKQELGGNRDVDVEDILSILPFELRSYIQSYTTLGKLRKVPKLQNMDEVVLQEICKNLKPKSYPANSTIILEQEPLEFMLLIVDGVVKVESSSDASASTKLETGELCGEELVDWLLDPLFPTILPLSTVSVRAMDNVEARVLVASDLYTVVTLFLEHFSESVFPPLPDLLRFNRLGLGNLLQLISQKTENLPQLRSAVHIKQGYA